MCIERERERERLMIMITIIIMIIIVCVYVYIHIYIYIYVLYMYICIYVIIVLLRVTPSRPEPVPPGGKPSLAARRLHAARTGLAPGLLVGDSMSSRAQLWEILLRQVRMPMRSRGPGPPSSCDPESCDPNLVCHVRVCFCSICDSSIAARTRCPLLPALLRDAFGGRPSARTRFPASLGGRGGGWLPRPRP